MQAARSACEPVGDELADEICVFTITADTALRLSRYFGLSERFWLNLQAHYDLEVEKDRLGPKLEKEVRVLNHAAA